MRPIHYYVAVSIDGFICGENEDISGFLPGGKLVDQYIEDLRQFDTVIMGRKTYEFGYQFGLQKGQPAYPHMEHYIFSDSISFENQSPKVHIAGRNVDTIQTLKQKEGTDIYLCGGGLFAGWLLDHQLIDLLTIKLNPLILGSGVQIFGNSKAGFKLNQLKTKTFEGEGQIIKYEIIYP